MKKRNNKARKSEKQTNWDEGAKASSYTDEFLEIKSGTTYIKLAESYYRHIFEHWFDDTTGKRRVINCAGKAGDKKGSLKVCPLCQASDDMEISTQHKYYFNVVVGKLKEVKGRKKIIFGNEVIPMKVGPSVGAPICAYAQEIEKDEEGEWKAVGIKDIMNVVLKITKTGAKLNTEYTVKHLSNVKWSVNGDLTETYDLDNYAKPGKSAEMLKSIGIEDKDDDEDEDYDDDFFDDEEDDEQYSKKSKKYYDDDDDDDDDDYDDDEPPFLMGKNKKKSKKNKKKKSKRNR